MIATIKTGPTVEPVTLAEAVEHMRVDTGTVAESITSYQSLVPDTYAIGNHTGTGVDVSGGDVVVNLNSGTYAAGATNDAKLQESDDDLTYTDVSGGAFVQVTTANDNAIQEKAYTGNKQYLRVYAAVAVDTADFSADIVILAATTPESTYIENLITSAREWVEGYTRRALVTQTWNYYLNMFPSESEIELPFGSLQSITSIKYTDSDETINTFSSGSYSVDTDSILGRAVLDYGESWPTDTLWTLNPIDIEIVCGYGLAASVPQRIKTAIKVLVSDSYEHRESQFLQSGLSLVKTDAVEKLLYPMRIFSPGGF